MENPRWIKLWMILGVTWWIIIGLDSGNLFKKGIKQWENMGITHGTVGIMIFESSMDKTCDYSQWKKNLEGEKHWDKHGTILGINMFLEKNMILMSLKYMTQKHCEFDTEEKRVKLCMNCKREKYRYMMGMRLNQVQRGSSCVNNWPGKIGT